MDTADEYSGWILLLDTMDGYNGKLSRMDTVEHRWCTSTHVTKILDYKLENNVRVPQIYYPQWRRRHVTPENRSAARRGGGLL